MHPWACDVSDDCLASDSSWTVNRNTDGRHRGHPDVTMVTEILCRQQIFAFISLTLEWGALSVLLL